MTIIFFRLKKEFALLLRLLPAIPAMILLFMMLCSCNNTNKKKAQEDTVNNKQKSLIIKKPGSSFDDTLVIKSSSAVFYMSDSLQMEKIERVNEKPTFDMLTHNCHYQMQNAREVIKTYWPQIKIIETSRYRFLLFEKANKEKKCVDLNNVNDICGLFLFDRKKDPALVDMPNIETQLSLYFSR